MHIMGISYINLVFTNPQLLRRLNANIMQQNLTRPGASLPESVDTSIHLDERKLTDHSGISLI